MPYFFLTLCSLFAVWIYLTNREKRKGVVAHLNYKKQKQKGDCAIMLKLVETLVGKNCNIHTIDNTYEGEIERVEDGWIILKDRWYNSFVFINPDYIVGIRECKSKKKKKQEVPTIACECAVTTTETQSDSESNQQS